MTRPWIDRIADLGACGEAVTWLRASPHATLDDAWAACDRGDWMLWLAGRVAGPSGDASRIPLVLAACDCAELALVHVPAGEDRPRAAIETARAWARGDATLEQVRAAARAAADAAADADAYAYAAASAASAAAYDASAAAYDASAAAYDASAAASAAAYDAADAYAARSATLARCADLVRRHYPAPPVLP